LQGGKSVGGGCDIETQRLFVARIRLDVGDDDVLRTASGANQLTMGVVFDDLEGGKPFLSPGLLIRISLGIGHAAIPR